MSRAEVGELAAIYPGVWGLSQPVTGALSDKIGRKGLIVGGCSRRLAMSRTRGVPPRSACTGSGAISATPSARCSPAWSRMHATTTG
jgi:MFS family permease